MKNINKSIKIEEALLVLLLFFILTSNAYSYAQVSCTANGLTCANGGTPFCGYPTNSAVYPACSSGYPICCSRSFGCGGSSASSSVECTTPSPPPVTPVIVVPTQPTTPSIPIPTSTCNYSLLTTVCTAQGFTINPATCNCGAPINPTTAIPTQPTVPAQPSSSCNCTSNAHCNVGKYCNLNTGCCISNPTSCVSGCSNNNQCFGNSTCVSNCCTSTSQPFNPSTGNPSSPTSTTTSSNNNNPQLELIGIDSINPFVGFKRYTIDLTVKGTDFESTSSCSAFPTIAGLGIRVQPDTFLLGTGISSKLIKITIPISKSIRKIGTLIFRVTCNNGAKADKTIFIKS